MKILFIEELPDASKRGCMEQSCKRFAHNKIILGKRGGLFQFAIYLCALCTNQAKKVFGLER